MVQIPKISTTAENAGGGVADATGDQTVAADGPAADTGTPAPRPMPADPWASLPGAHSLHADVQRFAEVARDRAEFDGKQRALPMPARDPVVDRQSGGDAARHANAPVLRWNPQDDSRQVGGGGPKKPVVYDVATTKQADIDKLKRTDVTDDQLKKLKHADVSAREMERLQKSPRPADQQKVRDITSDRQQAHDIEAQRRLASTIENARDSYKQLLADKGRIVVFASDANGGQPVMVVTGKGFKGDKDALVHTHYHGDNATVADPQGSKSGMQARIVDTITKNPQAVFVLPESANAPAKPDSPANNSKYSVNWREVKSQAQTTADAMAAAGVEKPAKQVVSLHSGAGKVVQVLMKLDPTGSLLKADRLELYDSLYGTRNHDWKKGPDRNGWEQSVADWGGTANGKAVERVIYYHGTNEGARINVIRDTFKEETKGGKLLRVAMDPKAIDDPAVNPKVPDAAGKDQIRIDYKLKDGKWVESRRSTVHRFELNTHYQTTGQFLGTEPPAPKQPEPKAETKRK